LAPKLSAQLYGWPFKQTGGSPLLAVLRKKPFEYAIAYVLSTSMPRVSLTKAQQLQLCDYHSNHPLLKYMQLMSGVNRLLS
jgi:hypothetical protein